MKQHDRARRDGDNADGDNDIVKAAHKTRHFQGPAVLGVVFGVVALPEFGEIAAWHRPVSGPGPLPLQGQ